MRNAIKRLIRERRESRVRKLDHTIKLASTVIDIVNDDVWPLDVASAYKIRASAARERASLLAKLHQED